MNTFYLIQNIGKVNFGFVIGKNWFFQKNQINYSIKNESDLIFLLPLLEIGRYSIFNEFQKIAKEKPELENDLMTFPEILLLQCAFNLSNSDYWIEKGIKWMKEMPSFPNEIKDNLLQLTKKLWINQKIRHQILKIIRFS